MQVWTHVWFKGHQSRKGPFGKRKRTSRREQMERQGNGGMHMIKEHIYVYENVIKDINCTINKKVKRNYFYINEIIPNNVKKYQWS